MKKISKIILDIICKGTSPFILITYFIMIIYAVLSLSITIPKQKTISIFNFLNLVDSFYSLRFYSKMSLLILAIFILAVAILKSENKVSTNKIVAKLSFIILTLWFQVIFALFLIVTFDEKHFTTLISIISVVTVFKRPIYNFVEFLIKGTFQILHIDTKIKTSGPNQRPLRFPKKRKLRRHY